MKIKVNGFSQRAKINMENYIFANTGPFFTEKTNKQTNNL